MRVHLFFKETGFKLINNLPPVTYKYRCVAKVTENLLAMFIGPQKADQLYLFHLGNETWEVVSDFDHGTAGSRCSSFMWEDREGMDDIVIALITSDATDNSHFFSLRVIFVSDY